MGFLNPLWFAQIVVRLVPVIKIGTAWLADQCIAFWLFIIVLHCLIYICHAALNTEDGLPVA